MLRHLLDSTVDTVKIMLDSLSFSQKPVVLYGAGQGGEQYLKILLENKINVYCFCDDNIQLYDTTICGYPILSLTDITNLNFDYSIFITSSTFDLYSNLVSAGLEQKLISLDLCGYVPDLQNWYFDHINKLQYVYDNLADERSKEVFAKILLYRLSREQSLVEQINDGEINQYFPSESFLKISNQEIFVDLGAYSGDTVTRFLDNCPKADGKPQFVHIYAFEPDPQNYDNLVRATSHLGNKISCFNLGVYNTATELKFQYFGGGAAFFQDI